MSDETGAAARLRAYEDKIFGAKVPRISGQVERGIGSPFQKMTDEHRKHYQALEHLVSTEERIGKAQGEMTAATVAHEAAMTAADESTPAEKTDDDQEHGTAEPVAGGV